MELTCGGALYRGATERSAAAAHCAATSAPAANDVATTFFILQFSPPTCYFIPFTAAKLTAFGYPWLTPKSDWFRPFGGLRYLVEHKGEIVPGGGRHKGA